MDESWLRYIFNLIDFFHCKWKYNSIIISKIAMHMFQIWQGISNAQICIKYAQICISLKIYHISGI